MSIADSAASDPMVEVHGVSPMENSQQSLWRSLKYFSYYRIVVACLFLGTIILSRGTLNLGAQDPRLFFWVCNFYLLAAIAALFVWAKWRTAFNLQLTFQVVIDLTVLTLLLFASGGVQSGLAMMMLVVLVGAGLVGQGRMVLFYAAIATVFLLAEQSLRILRYGDDPGDFFRSGLVSMGFFGSAIAARLLARRVVANEELAYRRGIELADQMRINERVIRDMQDGVLVVDTSGRVHQVNPQAMNLLDLPEVSAPMLAAYSPTLAREYMTRSSKNAETTVNFQSQTGRTLRARFLPPGEGGNTLVFLEDLGRLQQEAQQVKLAALGRLTANMAHEIRNPLAAISHAAELLQDEPEENNTNRLVRIIGDNTRRLNNLVAEVMELGRRDRARPESIDAGQSLRQLLEELALPDASVAQRVAINVPEGLSVCFDRGHFHRVFANLIDNALRYASQSQSAVQLTGVSGKLPGQAEIHVIDDGEGIPAEERQQIFEPFFTTRATGTGLGLYIARELCEANDARIALRENSPGAYFCISCRTTCQDSLPC